MLRHSDFYNLKICFLIFIHAHRQGNESTLIQKHDGLNADYRKNYFVLTSCNFDKYVCFSLTEIVLDFVAGILSQNSRHNHFVTAWSNINFRWFNRLSKVPEPFNVTLFCMVQWLWKSVFKA